jgi:riboflavin biosynthesis pyrimidine reductase
VLGSLIEADLVDEMCLTVTPLLLGGEASRVARSAAESRRAMALRHVLADDGELYLRYAKI